MVNLLTNRSNMLLVKEIENTRKLVVAGIVLLVVGLLFIWNPPPINYVTAVLDNTPPIITASTPANGITYASISQVNVTCNDPESGIADVTIMIDAATATAPLISGNTYGSSSVTGYWPSTNTPGIHYFTYTVTNGVGLQTVLSGSYTIYTALQGVWSINGIAITSASQVLKLSTLALTFNFTKTSGNMADSGITSTVTWTGPASGSLTLTNTATHQWTGTNTFTTGGSYTVTLKAFDGTTTITFAILDVGLQVSEPWPQLLLMQNVGIIFAIFGTIMIAVPTIYDKRKK